MTPHQSSRLLFDLPPGARYLAVEPSVDDLGIADVPQERAQVSG